MRVYAGHALLHATPRALLLLPRSWQMSKVAAPLELMDMEAWLPNTFAGLRRGGSLAVLQDLSN